MRAVYEQDEAKDKTAGQRAVRALLNKNPERFISQLAKLEEAELRAGGKAEPQAEDEERDGYRDEGLDRSQEAIRRWFEEAAERAREGTAQAGPAGPGVANGPAPLTPSGPPSQRAGRGAG
jgi:hypothetical protein